VRYDRTVVAYHGCDETVAQKLLAGEPFERSENDYDWLGRGVYFWEYGRARAMRFADEQVQRGRIMRPTVVGALIQLGECFDLMDTRFTEELATAHELLVKLRADRDIPLPQNAGKAPDQKLRRLDCAVMNFYLTWLEENTQVTYDTVRCGFVEGPPAFAGSGIHRESHVQIAVRNPACIVGVFRPTMHG
jgi:hypothetical protein